MSLILCRLPLLSYLDSQGELTIIGFAFYVALHEVVCRTILFVEVIVLKTFLFRTVEKDVLLLHQERDPQDEPEALLLELMQVLLLCLGQIVVAQDNAQQVLAFSVVYQDVTPFDQNIDLDILRKREESGTGAVLAQAEDASQTPLQLAGQAVCKARLGPWPGENLRVLMHELHEGLLKSLEQENGGEASVACHCNYLKSTDQCISLTPLMVW